MSRILRAAVIVTSVVGTLAGLNGCQGAPDDLAQRADAVSSGTVLLGVHVDEGSSSQSDFVAVETSIGRTLAIDSDYEDWFPNSAPVGFPDTGRIAWDQAHGRLTMISWRVVFQQADSDAGCATAQDIVAGVYDDQNRKQAADIKATGAPVLVRWNYEMTDNEFNECFNNGKPVNRGTYSSAGPRYVAAWRHIVDLFRAAGATNVQWVWAPSASLFTNENRGLDKNSWQLFYPGDGYVDWIANDHYNKTRTPLSYATDVDIAHFYSEASTRGKPLMQSETAANAGDQAEWISTARTALEEQYPGFKAYIWWDEGGTGGDGYPLKGAGLAAFQAMGSDPYFGGTYP